MKQKFKSGFTIVEVMVSMAVLILAIAASITTMGQALQSIRSSNAHMEAVQNLRTAYEEIRNNTHFATTPPFDGQTGSFVVNGHTINYTWNQDGAAVLKNWKLTLAMSYQEEGRTVRKEMSSLISETFHQ